MPANQTEQPAHPAPAASQGDPMTTSVGNQSASVLTEIEEALQVAENELPQLLGVLSIFIPGLKAITPFLGLLPVAIQAVDTVQKAESVSTPAAQAAVVQTLTPGQPGAPALN